MPELPEVEAARRAIQDNCVGRRIKKSTVADDPKVFDGISPSEFVSSLDGKTIVAAHRKGKNLWLQLDSPPFPSFQFGMTGAVYIKGVAVTQYKRSAVNSDDEWPSKYSKVFIELDDGLEFSFADKRRFAKVRLLQDPTSAPPISELGPDALFEPMKINEFVDALSKKKIAIKALLLDQAIPIKTRSVMKQFRGPMEALIRFLSMAVCLMQRSLLLYILELDELERANHRLDSRCADRDIILLRKYEFMHPMNNLQNAPLNQEVH